MKDAMKFQSPITAGPKIYIYLTLPNSDRADQSSHGKRGKHLCFCNGMETLFVTLILRLIFNTAQLRFYHCPL